MSRVLILSSHVAASRVGGGAQALALARLGIEPILVPTVLYGRHPGHGPPGGGAVEAVTFAAMLGGVEAQGLFGRLDAVITGYFSSPEQVTIAGRALRAVKAASPGATVIVDPIMGDDDNGLYVKEAVAEALAELLVGEADVLAPNAWELARLTGCAAHDPASAMAAAQRLETPVMVSSIRLGDEIGALYVARDEAWFACHAARDVAPKGTGDLLTALFTAGLLGGYGAPDALELAVGGVADAIAAAGGDDELPLTALPNFLVGSPRVRLEPLDG